MVFAVCALTTRRVGPGAVGSTLPLPLMVPLMMRGVTRTPPLAMVA